MTSTAKMNCGHCRKTIRFPASKVGRETRCPNCKHAITLLDESPPEDGWGLEVPAVADFPHAAPPPSPPAPIGVAAVSSERTEPSERRGRVPSWVLPVGVGAACLVVGFVAGREQMKYQIRSALRSAAEQIVTGMGEAFGGGAVSAANVDQGPKRDIAAEKQMVGLLRVNSSSFSWRESGFIVQPLLTISVTNETPAAITRAYFGAKLISPGRTVPWVDDGFNYEIPGGLEPGESATWELTPNMFGDWSSAPRDRQDLVLEVVPTGIDTADGKKHRVE